MTTTKKTKAMLLAATGLMAAMMCAPALAQDKPATDKKDETVKADDDLIIVKGLRKSLQSAANKKRKSAQITDSIVAEDVGKLPDNNVAEALSRVTGVQITRERGEGGSVSIRGMTDIQTTINGQASNSGTDRSAGLNDIPAELLKSVTVYKTRTADQVEGGIAGTVNVDLRRPLDLPKGWTLAGSVRNVYSDVGSTESPYFSALVANRWDLAGGGELGFLINASHQKNNYNEQYVESETPRPFWGDQYASLSADMKALNGGLGPIGVYRTRYGVERGYVERPAVNAAVQWRVNENLDFLLEGSMFKADEHRQMDVLDVRLKDSNAALSNVVLMPDGKTLRSATFTGTNLPVGVWGNDSVSELENQRVNFEAHWHNERWTVNGAVSRETSDRNMQWYRQTLRFNTLTSFFVDMNSDKTPEAAPYVVLNGVNLADINQYNLREIENGKSFENSTETVWQGDATYRISDDKFFRTFMFGGRYSEREAARAYGYRYAGFQDARAIKLTDFPGGSVYDTVSVDVPGFDSPVWHRINLDSLLANFDAVRALANDTTKRSYAGGSDGVPDWANPIVTTERSLGSFESTEKTTAFFGQFTYGFTLAQFPVDGIIGVRSTHTEGTSTTQARPGVDPITAPIDYTDVLPNVNAVVHFTDKLQLRMAYTKNVQRPGFGDATSWASLDTSPNGCHCGWGGNPDLRPNREESYDASMEYYFGRGGLVSFAAYLKKPDGFITWIHDTGPNGQGVPVAGYEGLYIIDHPLNAGPGTFQGYEFSAQGFFEFLPGFWQNFGASANFTYNQVAKIKYCYDYPVCEADGDFNAIGNSKHTYNLALYYDTPQFSARVAYNHRDRYRDGLDADYNQYSLYVDPTSRLDAAINYTPIKQLTLSLEATNLQHNDTKRYWGEQKLLPMGIRVQARTIQLSARFRY